MRHCSYPKFFSEVVLFLRFQMTTMSRITKAPPIAIQAMGIALSASLSPLVPTMSAYLLQLG